MTSTAIFLLLLPLFSNVNADLYVDSSGSDTNNGNSPTSPFKTLGFAVSLLQPNDIVHVAAATYSLQAPLKINVPNTTWTATTGNVYISGGQANDNWIPSSISSQLNPSINILQMNVSHLKLTSATRHLYINKRRVPRARLSTTDLNTLFAGSTISSSGYKLKPSNISIRVGSEFVYPQSTSPWTEPRCAVVSSNTTDIVMAQPCWNNLVHKACGQTAKGPPQYVEGVGPIHITSRGTWSLSHDAQRIFYSTLLSEKDIQVNAVVPILETLLEISKGGDGTTFNGFTFEHATWLRPGLGDGYVEQQTGQCTIGDDINNNDCNKDYWWSVKTPGNIKVINSTNVSFNKCEFTRLGGTALDYTFSHFGVVDSCYFHDISGSGIQIGSFQFPTEANLDVGTTIKNTIINKAGAEYSGAAGINVGYTQNVTIVHNDVSNLTYVPITVGWGWSRHECYNCTNAGNNTISHNRAHDYKQTLNDGGGIYMLGPQNNSLIFENWLYDQGTPSSGALYPDEGSAYSTFRRNVVTNIGSSQWLHLWNPSIHNVQVIGNFADTSVVDNQGTNCPMINNTVFKKGNPPMEAQQIMNSSGVTITNPWYNTLIRVKEENVHENVQETCPCVALNTYCNYASAKSPCPRQGVCHGTTTTCGCDNCPGFPGNTACKGCTPSPGPAPSPPVDRWCNHPSDCPETHTCCTCLCHEADEFVGFFDCKCKNGDKALPNAEQNACCGKPVDNFGAGPLWCMKAGAGKPMCSSHESEGVPTPAANYYQAGHIQRCAINCNTAFCDNKPALPCDHISSPPRCTGSCQPNSFLDTLVDDYERTGFKR